MARCLIIGCGCRGRALGRSLIDRGHAVRGTTRAAGGLAALHVAGIEPHVGDPDRISTLAPALDHVSVACVLLGSLTDTPEAIAALHGPRLEMLLVRMLDTTVRGVVYESAGTVPRPVLEDGSELVRSACRRSLIPYALLDSDPDDHSAWLGAGLAAVEDVLAA